MSDQPAPAHESHDSPRRWARQILPRRPRPGAPRRFASDRASESVAITGPSGCGKSTLLHLLGGLDRPTEGEVYFREEPLSKLDIDDFRAHQVGFVFQSFYLMPTLTALENIQIPMFEGPWSPRERGRASIAADRGGRSGGQRAITAPASSRSASASASRSRERSPTTPNLLLADEPTGNLDSKSQDEIIQLLHRLRDERQPHARDRHAQPRGRSAPPTGGFR